MEQLYRMHRRDALDRLGRLLRDRAWAEDVLQECFARLLEPHAAFAGRSDVRHWLDRVVTHRAVSELRRKPVRDEDLREGPLPADVALERAEVSARMRAALAQLPERDRILIALHHFEELGHAEISARLSMPEGTVKSALSRARDRLARAMRVPRTAELAHTGRGAVEPAAEFSPTGG